VPEKEGVSLLCPPFMLLSKLILNKRVSQSLINPKLIPEREIVDFYGDPWENGEGEDLFGIR
jgi:hypothetical protein